MTFEELMEAAHAMSVSKGFYDEVNRGERLALMHGEVSELLEHYRKGRESAPSEKIPEFTNEEEELADIVLRVMCWAQYRGVRLSQAMEAKHAYNLGRPVKWAQF